MKKLLFLLALLSLGTLTPVATAETAAPAAPAAETAAITIPVDSALTPAEQKAVRSYMLSSMRASAEAMLAQAETTTPTLRQMIQTAISANKNVSLDGLPANYRDFVLESRKLAQEAIDNMQGLDKTVDQLTEEDAMQMQASMSAVLTKVQELEARYPEVARYLGAAAQADLTQQLTINSGIQQKVMEELISRIDEFKGDQAQLSQLAIKLSCQYLLEEINKLAAE